jgi:hypothetical protein
MPLTLRTSALPLLIHSKLENRPAGRHQLMADVAGTLFEQPLVQAREPADRNTNEQEVAERFYSARAGSPGLTCSVVSRLRVWGIVVDALKHLLTIP